MPWVVKAAAAVRALLPRAASLRFCDYWGFETKKNDLSSKPTTAPDPFAMFFTQFFRGLSLQLMVNCKCWSSESETNSPDSILHFGWEPYPAFGAFAFFGFFGWPSPVFPLGNWFPPAVKWACFPVRLSAKLCRAALLACTLPETPIPSYRTFDRSPESRGVGSCVHYHGG